MRTQRTEALEKQDHVPMSEFGRILDLYFGGDMEAAIGLGGQVAGRIDRVEPVAEILDRTVREFHATVANLADRFASARHSAAVNS
jgi:enoyl-[acyl-carrier protein] reductase II